MNALWLDIKHGARMLAKAPGFTVIAVLTLALGIGANTAIFSLVDQILLQPLALPNPEQLIVVRAPGPNAGNTWSDGDPQAVFAYPLYRQLRESAAETAGLVARYSAAINISLEGRAERARGELVSGNYFEVLQVQPALGRLLTPGDETAPGADAVAVLSHRFWANRFGADPLVLNRPVRINAGTFTVVGVAPPGFDGIHPGQRTDVFLPVTMKAVITPNWDGLAEWSYHWLAIFGRMAPGLTREQAAERLRAPAAAAFEAQLPHLRSDWPEDVRKSFLAKRLELLDGSGGRPNLRRNAGTPLLVMMAMVGLVLLVACGNVANLVLARGLARQRECAVRLAMGASRWRLVRQMLTEAVMLAGGGAALGLLLALWLLDLLVSTLGGQMGATEFFSTSLNARLLGFAAVLAAVTAVLFGLLPALRATRTELNAVLKDQGATTVGGGQVRARKFLVVAQLAMTVLLIVLAGLLTRSFYELSRHELGVRPEGTLTFAVAPELSGYTPERTRQFVERLQESLIALPGVRAAGAAVIPVLANASSTSNITAEGYQPAESEDPLIATNRITPGFFSALGIPLLRGREFTRADAADAPKVAVVNQMMAQRYFGGDAVGKHFGFGTGDIKTDIEIVGLVADSHHTGVRDERLPMAYLPAAQFASLGYVTFYLRIEGDPAASTGPAREAVARLDADLPIYAVRTMQEQVASLLAGDRMVTQLSAAFGLVAGLLAALGIAGVMMYSVTRRTREIGIRMAIGARAGDVYRMVLREVIWMAAAGAAVGVPLALVAARLIRSLLFGVEPVDFAVVAGALAFLAVLALAAGYLPARRAARVDPVVALRHE
jgi:predicted permease